MPEGEKKEKQKTPAEKLAELIDALKPRMASLSPLVDWLKLCLGSVCLLLLCLTGLAVTYCIPSLRKVVPVDAYTVIWPVVVLALGVLAFLLGGVGLLLHSVARLYKEE